MEKLIVDYMNSAAACLDLFEQQIGRRDIMKAVAEGALARAGELASGIRYQVHGVGCRVEFPDRSIDFDFATSEGDVGFDAWRLWIFAEQYPERYPQFQKKAAIDAALEEGLSNGSVSPFEGNERLLRWSGIKS